MDDDYRGYALIRMIRQQACQGLRVDALAGQLDMSRSSLERRFLALVGRTPQEEIQRVQRHRAQELLA
jgi:LacI family transcriptional regulator